MTNEEILNAILTQEFSEAKRMAEEKFGKQNVDFQLNYAVEDFGVEINSLHEYKLRIRQGTSGATLFYIIIHLPHKTVTCNELGTTHDVYDIYCRIAIKLDKTFEIRTARSRYTSAEINSQYTHSHVSGISSDICPWLTTCLGRDNTPLNRLRARGLNDSLDWMELFDEVDRFYEVESLTGAPYRRMSNISNFSAYYVDIQPYMSCDINRLAEFDEDFSDFAYFTLQNIYEENIPLFCANGSFVINLPIYKLKVKLTNLIIKYLNQKNSEPGVDIIAERKKFDKVLEKHVKTPIGMYTPLIRRNDRTRDGDFLFTFKGVDVKVRITGRNEDTYALMPNLKFILYIYLKISIMLNYERYRNTDPAQRVKIVL